MSKTKHAVPFPITPDGRYFIVRGRLWRCSNPELSPAERSSLVSRLMNARRAVSRALREKDGEALAGARELVDEAKVALGERGPPWWGDGGPDFNRHMVKNLPYRDWYEKNR